MRRWLTLAAPVAPSLNPAVCDTGMSDEEHHRFVRMARLIAAESAPIAEMLEAQGLAQYATLLASHGVTHASLPEITTPLLAGISGLRRLDREKLVAAAQALREAPSPSDANSGSGVNPGAMLKGEGKDAPGDEGGEGTGSGIDMGAFEVDSSKQK